MIAVSDVEKSSAWYCEVLGATSGHGGAEYEQLIVDGELVLQLHSWRSGTTTGRSATRRFRSATVSPCGSRRPTSTPRSREPKRPAPRSQTDTHHNPNAHHEEIWLRDPDNYLVVLSS